MFHVYFAESSKNRRYDCNPYTKLLVDIFSLFPTKEENLFAIWKWSNVIQKGQLMFCGDMDPYTVACVAVDEYTVPSNGRIIVWTTTIVTNEVIGKII